MITQCHRVCSYGNMCSSKHIGYFKFKSCYTNIQIVFYLQKMVANLCINLTNFPGAWGQVVTYVCNSWLYCRIHKTH